MPGPLRFPFLPSFTPAASDADTYVVAAEPTRLRSLDAVEASAGRRGTSQVPADLDALIRGAATRDPDAFEALYRTFYPRIFAYAAVRLRSREEAADAAQECFLTLWRNIGGFEPRHPHAFEAWMFRVIRNIVIDRAKRRGRELPSDDVSLGDRSIEFESGVLGSRELARLLDEVSDDQREVLILRFCLDLPIAEVAAITGKSQKAVTALQLRGLERLEKAVTR